MKKGKLISLLLCLVLLLGMAVPGALAVSADEDAPDGTESVQTADQTEDAGDEAQAGLFDRIMDCTTMDEVDAVTTSATEEELSALTEEEYTQLIEHVRELAAAEYVAPETVVFTDAGPFLPPVNVGSALRAMRAGETEETGNGLELSKTVSANDDGYYTIRMEAYTTGKVTTTTKTVPVDIVLVLDQSGSMADDFGDTTRQAALKNAVNSFIDSVAKKYNPEESDHRMAIVTFGSEADTLLDINGANGWTYVDDAGQTMLKHAINRLPEEPEGATRVDLGMSEAETLMGSGYNYTGPNEYRQKVVIVFTDGVPTTYSDFSTDVANDAITSSKNLKDAGATVYTVGIFNGANPNELYGASGFDTNSDGTEESRWIMDTWGFFPGTDFPEADRPAGNRFLNYLSSNFQDSSSLGLTRDTSGLGIFHYKITYTITANATQTTSGYYLTADDSESLNGAFQDISENIQRPNIELESETVIKDKVTQYFNVPEDASDVRIYTADYNGTSFGADETVGGVTAEVNKATGVVTVTGFDFNANFVSAEEKTDGTHGKKLIIEFDITPKSGFIGGNAVPTNDYAASGVYDEDGTEVERFADSEADTPKVNVPIDAPVVNNVIKTIYEGNSVQVSELYDRPNEEGWQYDYVDVSVTGIEGDSVSPTDCTAYDITMTYAPKFDGSGLEGTENPEEGVSGTGTATVHVLKSTVTVSVNDVEKYYGENYTLGEGVNGSAAVTWTDKTEGHTDIPEAEGEAPYIDTDLELAYEYSGALDGSVTVPKSDFDVTVKVLKNGEELTGDFITINVTCDIEGAGCDNTRTDDSYTVHVKTGSLTVVKTGGAENEPYVFTVYKDGTEYTELTIVGNDKVTISELPAGTYSIKEDTGWSWRYDEPEYSADVVTLGGENTSGTITCTNTLANGFWLNGFSAVVKNVFVEKH